MILPDTRPSRRTPQSLPLRERVWLAQRIALARFLGIKWADIARLEGMSERTLRYHLARWRKELEQEQEQEQRAEQSPSATFYAPAG